MGERKRQIKSMVLIKNSLRKQEILENTMNLPKGFGLKDPQSSMILTFISRIDVVILIGIR